MGTTQIITFGTSESVSAKSFTFEIQGETSVFASGATATLNMYPSDSTAALFVSAGYANFIKRGEVKEQTEYIVFANSDTAYTQYDVNTLISAEWQGVIAGNVNIYGNEITLPAAATGVLKVVYNTLYDVISLTCNMDTQCLLTATGTDRFGYVVVDYTYNISGSVAVVLKVRDACSGAVLSDAHVWLNGGYKGITDSDGYINLGKLNPGTYSLKTTKTGYQDSDQDIISNDSFTVE